MRLDLRTSGIITATLLLLPSFVFAATESADNTYGYNLTLISLVCLMLTLLLVIAVLANVLRQLTAVVSERNRKGSASGVAKTLLLLVMLASSALPAFAADGETAAPVAKFISGIPEDDFYMIMFIIGLELAVIFALTIFIRQLLSAISSKPEVAKAARKAVQASWFWDKFNAAVPMEKEKDLLLDHDYDGIQELDNSLPPWWKYGFYLTIVVAFIYLYRFHVSHDGLSQQDEYLAEMQKGEEDKAEYLAKAANNVDETNVVALTGAGEIAAGKELFSKSCIACHLADGGGSVGPNLTDPYWLHGGSIQDVFKSIKYGWQDKGMKSWKDDFSPKDIQLLASYVKSLAGTHPANPKAQQGELFIEASSGGNAVDSNTVKQDSTGRKKIAALK